MNGTTFIKLDFGDQPRLRLKGEHAFALGDAIHRIFALLLIRNERPVIDSKYDLMKHPNLKHTVDGGCKPFEYETDLTKPRYIRPAACELLSGDEAVELVA